MKGLRITDKQFNYIRKLEAKVNIDYYNDIALSEFLKEKNISDRLDAYNYIREMVKKSKELDEYIKRQRQRRKSIGSRVGIFIDNVVGAEEERFYNDNFYDQEGEYF